MALSFNPQELPVVGTDDHLPAVDSGRLQPDALRRRFRLPLPWQPEISTERRIGNDRLPADAAVLIPLVSRAGQLHVLLTQRTDHLTDHPGQISFPGGRTEAIDADAVATALREAREEIGLDPAFVDVLGVLPTYTTGTGFVVTPVVALVAPGFTIRADPFEVAEVFEVPLEFLMTPAHHRWHRVEVAGTTREFLSMPWQADSADVAAGADGSTARPRRYFVWGATAAMLRNLYRFLSA